MRTVTCLFFGAAIYLLGEVARILALASGYYGGYPTVDGIELVSGWGALGFVVAAIVFGIVDLKGWAARRDKSATRVVSVAPDMSGSRIRPDGSWVCGVCKTENPAHAATCLGCRARPMWPTP
jgi:hypothetical protein